MTVEPHALAARALLEWYHYAGVDEAATEEPRAWFSDAAPDVLASVAAPPSVITSAPPTSDTSPDARALQSTPAAAAPAPAPGVAEAIASARRAADAADSLEALYAAIRSFEGCALKRTAMNTVTHDGVASADMMLIGEAPGADEDRRGIPFCGASGQLLDKMFAAIGRSRTENLYITNMLFWRPPGNRNPTPEELAICRPFVERHIALLAPKVIVLVGGISAKELLAAPQGITRLRGKQHHYTCPHSGREIPAFALFHPSYLLRQPEHKALAWKDLLQIRSAHASLVATEA